MRPAFRSGSSLDAVRPSGNGRNGRCPTATGSFSRTATEAGEAHYAVMIRPGETIWFNGSEKARVLDGVAVEEDDSPYVGFLKVEAM
jgi:hypothetical protein